MPLCRPNVICWDDQTGHTSFLWCVANSIGLRCVATPSLFIYIRTVRLHKTKWQLRSCNQECFCFYTPCGWGWEQGGHCDSERTSNVLVSAHGTRSSDSVLNFVQWQKNSNSLHSFSNSGSTVENFKAPYTCSIGISHLGKFLMVQIIFLSRHVGQSDLPNWFPSVKSCSGQSETVASKTAETRLVE